MAERKQQQAQEEAAKKQAGPSHYLSSRPAAKGWNLDVPALSCGP